MFNGQNHDDRKRLNFLGLWQNRDQDQLQVLVSRSGLTAVLIRLVIVILLDRDSPCGISLTLI